MYICDSINDFNGIRIVSYCSVHIIIKLLLIRYTSHFTTSLIFPFCLGGDRSVEIHDIVHFLDLINCIYF